MVERDQDEINQQIDAARDNDGKYRGQTYEEGVRNALEWVTGETDELPMESDE